jgi:CheY-like chemotaxis protein
LRRALRRQLEGLGAEVADFGDGEGARRAVVAGPAFDVTVIDAEMPGGGELAPRLYLDAGPLPTVILTRTGVVAAPAALLTRDHVRVLCKPCAPRDLVEAIEGVIAAPSLAATAAAIEVDADDPRSPASDAESR